MKKTSLILIFSLVVLAGLYLNRSYAHIYKKIDDTNLQSPVTKQSYDFGDDSKKHIVYVALGDSLTSGVGVESYQYSYPYLLSQKLSSTEHVQLKTFAVQGARTSTVLEFADEVIQINSDIITILIGVNDVHGNIPLEEFTNNYNQLLKKLTAQTSSKIYIVAIPYIGDSSLMRFPYNYYFDYQTRRFNTVLKELADQYKTEYIDLYSTTLQASRLDTYYSSDLFHPSLEGYDLWAQIIYDNLNQ